MEYKDMIRNAIYALLLYLFLWRIKTDVAKEVVKRIKEHEEKR